MRPKERDLLMMTDEPVQLERQQGIASLILNRPDIRNAFDDSMIQALSHHLTSLKADPSVRIILLRGKGDHFCAGANIEWMRRQAQASAEENYQGTLKLARLLQSLNEINKPTIALVQGSVYGGAIGLMACCDIVLAAMDTVFCFSEVKLGLIPAVVGPYVIPTIGVKAARHYMLTAEPFAAREAKRLGLVHEILPFQQLALRATELSEGLLKNGPQALGKTKQFIQAIEKLTLTDPSLVERTAQLIAELRASEEGQEGLSAFLEKRNPRWVKGAYPDKKSH